MNHTSPKVKILLLCYNSENTINETLFSLVNQTYENYEIHVLDNASTDSSLEIVKQFKSAKLFSHPLNSTISGYENYDRALKMADYDYSAIFHSDDVYDKDIIREQVGYLESNENVGIVFTQAYKINEESKIIGKINFPLVVRFLLFLKIKSFFNTLELLKLFFKYDNFLICPSAMARSSIYKTDLKRNRVELFKSAADVDNWLRISEKYEIGLISKRLIKYRISTNQFSAENRLKRTRRGDVFKVFNYYRSKYRQDLNKIYLFFLKNLKITDDLITAYNHKTDCKIMHKRIKNIGLGAVLIYSLTGVKGFKSLLLFFYIKLMDVASKLRVGL